MLIIELILDKRIKFTVPPFRLLSPFAPGSYKLYPDGHVLNCITSEPYVAPVAATSASADLATPRRRLPLDGVKRNDCFGHGGGEGCRSRGCSMPSVRGAEAVRHVGREGPVSEGGGTAPPLRAAQEVLDGYLHTYLRADEDRYKDEPQGLIIVSFSYLPFHQSDSVL